MEDPNWPALPYDDWRDTMATLHRYTQIVGKIQLACTPRINHFWNVAFHFTAHGWRTALMKSRSGDLFDIEFDFTDHRLLVRTADGTRRALPLFAQPVADFYTDLFALLHKNQIDVAISDHPVEIAYEKIPFHEDRQHAAYDRKFAQRHFHIVAQSAAILEKFRGRFIGKASPVHFFWGSFDLAASRYSGGEAPVPPGTDLITAESYSHAVSSTGFWPGDPRHPAPAYYTYFVPRPEGYGEATVLPASAFWHESLGEFVLPYDDLRTSDSPEETLLEFCQSTYEAGAMLAGWDRAALERPAPPPSGREEETSPTI
jgi:hypothetical protein